MRRSLQLVLPVVVTSASVQAVLLTRGTELATDLCEVALRGIKEWGKGRVDLVKSEQE